MTQWIKHDGGTQPVPDGTLVATASDFWKYPHLDVAEKFKWDNWISYYFILPPLPKETP